MSTVKTHASQMGGRCRNCGEEYPPGTTIVRVAIGRFVHIECLTDKQLQALEETTT